MAEDETINIPEESPFPTDEDCDLDEENPWQVEPLE